MNTPDTVNKPSEWELIIGEKSKTTGIVSATIKERGPGGRVVAITTQQFGELIMSERSRAEKLVEEADKLVKMICDNFGGGIVGETISAWRAEAFKVRKAIADWHKERE